MQRSATLNEFTEALRGAFDASSGMDPQAAAFVSELFRKLAEPAAKGSTDAAQLPVCSHLPAAIKLTLQASPQLAALAAAFAQIAPQLAWQKRPSSGPNASENWPQGHANAVIIGQGGLEERGDIAIGASLLAPNVRYPDHTHPPEELYMVMAPGRFQHGDEDWQQPAAGSTFHNAPGIKHAMASGASPLLAIWTMISR